VSTTIAAQLLAAAAWAEATPGYEVTAPPLRLLVWYARTGELDLSRLPPPAPDEGTFGGLLARLRRIGVDVWEMCGAREAGA
jgi:hypothetical protein